MGAAYDALKLKDKAVRSYFKAAKEKETIAMGNLAHYYLEAGFVDDAKKQIVEANKLLSNTTSDQKVDILFDHCGIDFFDCYPVSLIRGVAVYKVPTIVPTKSGEVRKNKWKLNWNIPDFLDDKDFLYNILLNGADVYRAQNILT